MDPSKKVSIVIIDDEPQMTKLLKMILTENINATVETFNDSQSALERLKTSAFDMISLDFRMPVMTGIELLTEVRKGSGPNKRTPVLLFTGFRKEAEPLAYELMEDLIFLEKPVENERYVAAALMALQMKKRQVE